METIYGGWWVKQRLKGRVTKNRTLPLCNFLSDIMANFIYISPYLTLHLSWTDLDVHTCFYSSSYRNIISLQCVTFCTVDLLYLCVYPFLLGPPSYPPPPHPSSHQEHWAELPLLYSRSQLTVLHLVVHIPPSQPPSSSHHSLPCPHVHPYVCVSIPSLQTGSSVPFF